MRTDTQGEDIVRRAGHTVVGLAETDVDVNEILRIATEREARHLILDVRRGISRDDVLRLRNRLLVAVIDDPGERRLAADMVFFPPIPQLKRWTWEGFTGHLNAGWEWVILRREFAAIAQRFSTDPPVLLVTMGGTDPLRMTAKVLHALEGHRDFYPMVVLGGGTAAESAVARLRAEGRRVEFLAFTENVAAVMDRVDFAVASFGVTAYELAAAGVPAIYLCLTDDHAESATALVDAGAGLSLGFYSDVSDRDIADAVTRLGDRDRRTQMAHRGRELIDGRGAGRVADYITNVSQR